MWAGSTGPRGAANAARHRHRALSRASRGMGRCGTDARAGGGPLSANVRLLLAAALSLAAAQTARVMVTGSLMSGDAVYHFCHLHTLVVDRDLDPGNEIAHYQQ